MTVVSKRDLGVSHCATQNDSVVANQSQGANGLKVFEKKSNVHKVTDVFYSYTVLMSQVKEDRFGTLHC